MSLLGPAYAVSDQIVCPLQGRVYAQDLAATAQLYEIPKEWMQTRYVTIQTFTDPMFIQFGDSSVVATSGARNSLVGNELIPLDTVTWRVVPEVSMHILIPPTYLDASGTEGNVTHFSVLGDAGPPSGYWQARVSST